MTKRERILAAIRRRPVDRLPTTYRGLPSFTEKLLAALGFDGAAPHADVRRDFLSRLKADFWSSGSKPDKFSTFGPRYLGAPPQPPYVDDGTSFYKIGIHSVSDTMPGYDVPYPVPGVDPPLAAASSASDIPAGFLMGRLDSFDFHSVANRYRSVAPQDIGNSDDDLANLGTLGHPFMICSYLRGMKEFLLDMAFDGKLAARLSGEVGDFILEFNRRELQSLKGLAVYYGTWDDVAGQNGMLFSPELFKRHFLPTYRRLIGSVHAAGLLFGWHCCGSVHEVLPLMIDAGIDVFDVVQTSARDMDLVTMRKRYGNAVCLHGGIDVQKDLVQGKPADIRALVRKVKELWGTQGGIILAPSHETLPDTPAENMLALYDELAAG